MKKACFKIFLFLFFIIVSDVNASKDLKDYSYCEASVLSGSLFPRWSWGKRYLVSKVKEETSHFVGTDLFENMATQATFSNGIFFKMIDYHRVASRIKEGNRQPIKIKRTPINFVRGIYNTFMDFREMGVVFQSSRFLYQIEPNIPFFTIMDYSSESHDLTDLGKTFSTHVKGHTFIDLGCGDPNYSLLPRVLAQCFDATTYIGVDSQAIPKLGKTRINEFPGLSSREDFSSFYFKDDILLFLKQLKRPGPVFFFIEGIEVITHVGPEGEPVRDLVVHQRAHEYLKQVMMELKRITQPGDGFFIGRVVSFLHPARDVSEKNKKWRDLAIDPSEYGFIRIKSYRSDESPDENSTINDRYDLWKRI